LAQPDPRLQQLAQRWWPGPLTVVAPACEGISERITAGLGTVALRVPDQPQCTAVLARFGRAVVLTSANRHGEPPARSAEAVATAFPNGLGALIDGGPCTIGEPSTIVALLQDGRWQVLREGAIGHTDLASVLDT
jgi:L-threonylcarbamoyladenylate synthase